MIPEVYHIHYFCLNHSWDDHIQSIIAIYNVDNHEVFVTDSKSIALEMMRHDIPVIGFLNKDNEKDMYFIPYATDDLSVISFDYVDLVWHHTNGVPMISLF